MDNLIIPGTDFTPSVAFLAETGRLEVSGISRPEDVAGFYEDSLRWLNEFEEEVFRSDHKYAMDELRLVFKMSYFNSSSSKYFIHILRCLKNIENKGIQVRIEWHYEEGDEKMMEDGEDLAEAVDLEFEYHEM